MLSVDNVSLRFGHLRVLTDLSLSIQAGEVLAVLGGNAAGKTSLLRVISGLVRPQEGQVLWHGHDITRLGPDVRVRDGLAFCPDERQLFPEMTVYENLEMGLHAHPKGRSLSVDSAIQPIVELFPILAERAEQRAGSLSGGEQKMVAIGRALLTQPRLLMLDEPSLGLSPEMRETVAHAVVSLHEQGMTILLTEQDVALAQRLAERVLFLERGAIVNDE